MTDKQTEGHVPATKEETPDEPAKTPRHAAGAAAVVAASVSKAVVAKSALSSAAATIQGAVIAVFKPVLQWWFRSPAKLFRPYRVDPWSPLRRLAEHEGVAADLGFVLRARGPELSARMAFVRANAGPLLVANALCGMALFQGYAITAFWTRGLFYRAKMDGAQSNAYWESVLPAQDRPMVAPATREMFPLWRIGAHHFCAGAAGGVAQGLLASPWDLVRARAEELWTPERSMGQCLRIAASEQWRSGGEAAARTRALLKDALPLVCAKDALAFGVFFSSFQTAKIALKRAAHDAGGHRPLDILATVVAGAWAGVTYQLVAHPLAAVQQAMSNRNLSHSFHVGHLDFEAEPRPLVHSGPVGAPSRSALVDFITTASRLCREHGVSSLYRGIAPTLLRTMPPSSLGLLVFELLSEP